MSNTTDNNMSDSNNNEEPCYRALVVDSGPIIRHTGLSSLRNRANTYYTVPAVLQEIRDAKARQHLEQLPFEIITREASPEGIQAVIDFSRQTGDYQSLSAVDLQILGLLYDLECEGCEGEIAHIRTTPKRTVGVGRVKSLGSGGKQSTAAAATVEADRAGGETDQTPQTGSVSFFEGKDVDIVDEDDDDDDDDDVEEDASAPSGPKTWAMLVNPAAAPVAKPTSAVDIAEQALTVPFGQMKLKEENASSGGQFSDAEEDDDDLDEEQTESEDEDDDDDRYADEDAEISDEECDVYILDPEEVEERKRAREAAAAQETDKELASDFPSLAASLQVAYDGSDAEETEEELNAALLAKQKAEQKREESLKPKTNSGKMYNSFRKYGDVIKPKEPKPEHENVPIEEEPEPEPVAAPVVEEATSTDNQSRIIGGTGFSGQGNEVEDDGEGWITCTKDINKMKAVGRLQPTVSPTDVNNDESNGRRNKNAGPPITQRTACATTDFAMQNVILQMNLELLSVDGMKVRRLKSWVSRCGACFTVFSNDASASSGPYQAKRLFCARCGSDMIQRVACSVDSKTGRLRLHLSKKYKTNVRGTKFSLPKAGSNNRFQGDLLLREDQLMMGAWNQKVKKLSGGKSRSSATSMFGSDLASNVGCHAKVVHQDDIRVGFGRRNPNSTKGGRERRGKKKKNGDKACGLRRY